MQTNFPEGGIINLTINNMDGNHLPSPAPAPSPEKYTGMGRPPRGHASAERGRHGHRLRNEILTSGLNTSMVI